MLRALLKALPLLALLLPGLASAQSYPTKPIKIVVPFPAGGGVDALGRIVQPGLQEKLGQPIIVENKPGAGGTIGTEFTINQPKDGYTILIGSPGAISVAPSLNRKLPYDPAKDLVPLTMGVRMPNLLVVHPSVQATNVQELIALAKAQRPLMIGRRLGVDQGGVLSSAFLPRETLFFQHFHKAPLVVLGGAHFRQREDTHFQKAVVERKLQFVAGLHFPGRFLGGAVDAHHALIAKLPG